MSLDHRAEIFPPSCWFLTSGDNAGCLFFLSSYKVKLTSQGFFFYFRCFEKTQCLAFFFPHHHLHSFHFWAKSSQRSWILLSIRTTSSARPPLLQLSSSVSVCAPVLPAASPADSVSTPTVMNRRSPQLRPPPRPANAPPVASASGLFSAPDWSWTEFS